MATRMLISVDMGKCTGCRMCEVSCSLHHSGECKPSHSRIRVAKKEEQGIHVPILCMQCSDAPCVEACPKNAMVKDNNTGGIIIKEELCIGCKLCFMACPVGAIHFPQDKKKAVKCDLCGGKPQCVEFCEPEALQFIAEVNFHQRKSENILNTLLTSKNIVQKISTSGEIRI